MGRPKPRTRRDPSRATTGPPRRRGGQRAGGRGQDQREHRGGHDVMLLPRLAGHVGGWRSAIGTIARPRRQSSRAKNTRGTIAGTSVGELRQSPATRWTRARRTARQASACAERERAMETIDERAERRKTRRLWRRGRLFLGRWGRRASLCHDRAKWCRTPRSRPLDRAVLLAGRILVARVLGDGPPPSPRGRAPVGALAPRAEQELAVVLVHAWARCPARCPLQRRGNRAQASAPRRSLARRRTSPG